MYPAGDPRPTCPVGQHAERGGPGEPSWVCIVDETGVVAPGPSTPPIVHPISSSEAAPYTNPLSSQGLINTFRTKSAPYLYDPSLVRPNSQAYASDLLDAQVAVNKSTNPLTPGPFVPTVPYDNPDYVDPAWKLGKLKQYVEVATELIQSNLPPPAPLGDIMIYSGLNCYSWIYSMTAEAKLYYINAFYVNKLGITITTHAQGSILDAMDRACLFNLSAALADANPTFVPQFT